MIKVNGYPVIVNHFPDKTQHIVMPRFQLYMDFEIIDVLWNYESDEEYATLMYVKGHLDKLFEGRKIINLRMPYVPNARMDRSKHKTSDVFTLKYFANFINSLKFTRVFVIDVHSPVSEALFDNIGNQSPDNHIDDTLHFIADSGSPIDAAYFPDEGSMKRYKDLIKIPYCFGVKNRDWQSGQILGLDIVGDESLIKGKNILMIDDICSRGGTFYHSAKKLKELGANKVYAYATHCEDSIFDGELLKGDLLEKIYVTDSIFKGEHEKIHVLPLPEYGRL